MSDPVDWARYRVLCDRGDVLSRWLVEQTGALLETDGHADLAGIVRGIADAAPLPRPSDHRGGTQTEFFEARMALEEVRAVASAVRAAAMEPGRRLPGGRGLGGMAEAWQEYADWLDGTHPRSPRRTTRTTAVRERI